MDVGEARVVELDDFTAVVEHEGESEARPGYRARFELPGGRISPSEVIRLAADRLDEAQFDEIVTRMSIDRRPFTQKDFHVFAPDYEFEWEVPLRETGVDTMEGIPEQNLQRFLDPAKSHINVGLRCAYSTDGASH